MFEEPILTYEEYSRFMNGLGHFNKVTIDISYNFYLAMLSNDSDKMVKSMNNAIHNSYFYQTDRFN